MTAESQSSPVVVIEPEFQHLPVREVIDIQGLSLKTRLRHTTPLHDGKTSKSHTTYNPLWRMRLTPHSSLSHWFPARRGPAACVCACVCW